jgi:2C-methyl-D-erythritol 2,4-cyclodiphosphate synthase
MNSEDTNKRLNEVRLTMQDMKEEFNEHTEILKKNQSEILEINKSNINLSGKSFQ